MEEGRGGGDTIRTGKDMHPSLPSHPLISRARGRILLPSAKIIVEVKALASQGCLLPLRTKTSRPS